MDKEVDKVLKKYYYNVEDPSSFSSASKLYHIVKAAGKNIGYHKIRRWLNAQDNYSLQKTPRRSFKRLRVYTTGISNLWDADLMDVQNITKENDGFKYILVVIDVFSRFLWMRPLKSKTGVEVTQAFRTIFKNVQPEKLRTDKDKCFVSKQAQTLFKEIGVRHFVTQNEEIKANYAERVIQTMKNRFFRYFTKKRTHRYIDVLQKFVKSYNNTPHRSLNNMCPASVNPSNESNVWGQQYLGNSTRKNRIRQDSPGTGTKKEKRSKRERTKYRYKIGSLVRISHAKHIFERSYGQKWTDEVFKVIRRFKSQNINLYKLSDINGDEIIKGNFYESELQRVDKDSNSLWIVEKIIKKKKINGVPHSLVKFQGWGSKYNQYIPTKDIKSLT